MPKTQTHTTPNSSPDPTPGSERRPLFPDAKAVVEAAREAALSGIDGTLVLQEEMQKAYAQSLDQLRTEADSWTAMVQKVASESAGAGWDISHRSLTVVRDQIERLGKAPRA